MSEPRPSIVSGPLNRTHRRVPVILGVLGFIALAVFFFNRSFRTEKQDSSRVDQELGSGPKVTTPEAGKSAFESTRATYVGLDACVKCHPDQHRTHRGTTHSQALAEVDATLEPPDTTFEHAASGRTYRVYRGEDGVHHREFIMDSDGTELIAADHRVKFVVGSGHFTRSYLIEDDGFLAESPITWYQSKQAWGLSPGYDRPEHPGFERAVDASCLYCHVGRMKDPEHRYQRVSILEQSIGCERCHGPGSLHVEQYQRDDKHSAVGVANGRPTIVNPSKLSRTLNESVCAHCHLVGETLVSVRGRSLYDFQPGLPLTDFCINYRFDQPDSAMKVVGHVEQMHESACYRGSNSLTCTTCHGGHSEVPRDQFRSHHIDLCKSCHSTDNDCKFDLKTRLERSSSNDCVACHMPQVSTDIPHVAFTHHRIGIHENPSSPKPPREQVSRKVIPELVPMDDVSHLSETERDRNLGLAYFQFSQNTGDRRLMDAYRLRAIMLLTKVRSSGLSDSTVTASLLQLYYLTGDTKSARILEPEILPDREMPVKARISSLFLIATDGVKSNRIEAAKLAIEELIQQRRHPADWALRATYEQRSGDLAGALKDFERAAAISPFRPQIHDSLAQIHQQLGHQEAAERERRIAKGLMQHRR